MIGVIPTLAVAGMGEQERRLRALEAKAGAESELLKILQRFTWNGDLRLRYQNQEVDSSSNTLDRDRFRLRFRLGATVHMAKDLDIGFRLETGDTGTSSSTSGNQTFDNGFSRKAFDLGRAYAKWTPGQFTFEGGKFGVPFMKSSMLWDSDVNVEGLSQQYSRKMGDTELRLVLGQFVIEELSSAEDVILYAYQGIIGQDTPFGKFTGAVAFYDYANHEDPSTITDTGSGNNNNLSEVKVLDIMAKWSEKVYGRKLTVFGEYAENTGTLAPGQPDLDTAWDAGFKYGKAGKKFGDWAFGLNYRVVQAEAVFEPLADSDTNLGSNGFRGYKAYGYLGLKKGVKLKMSYYDTQAERGAKNDIDVFQTDLIFKF